MGGSVKRCNAFFLLTLTFFVAVLVSCNLEPHVHTFDKNWSSDEINHWHVATCEHTDEVSDKAAHTFGSSETIKESTCAEEGYSEQVCNVCGYIKKTIIQKKTHTYVISAGISPSCTEPGFSEGIECSECGEIITPAKEIKALGHDFSSTWTTDKAPTCTEEGSKSHHCSRCDEKSEVVAIPASGHQSVVDDEVAATCLKSGLSAGSHCSVCGITLVKQNLTAALGHDYESTHVAPTCISEGYTTYTCSRCSDTFKSGNISALGHSLTDVEAKEPTCTEIGWSTYQYCSRCDYTTYSEKQAKGHSAAIDKRIEPTCTVKGLTEGSHCSVCNDVLTAQVEIPAKGHSFMTPVVTEPTCEEKGYTTHTCNVCSYYFVDTYVEAKGHTIVNDEPKAASCLEPGLTAGNHCSVCNKVFTAQTPIPALGHNLSDHEAKTPTCTEKGWEAYQTCSRCDYTSYQEIPANGHSFDSSFTVDREATCLLEGIKSRHCSKCDAVTEETAIKPKGHRVIIDEAVAATCTTTGKTKGEHCGTCSEILISQETIAALGHDYVSTVIAPTCEEDGYTIHKCSRCSHTYSDTVVEKTGHTDVVDLAVAPTCLSTGLTQGSHCNICNKVLVEQTKLPELGHDYIYHDAKAATCTEIGWDDYYTCSRCEYSTYVEKSALGHDYINHEAKAATCVGIGWNAYTTCSRCDYSTYSEIPALGHDLINHEAKSESCLEVGWDEYKTCNRCDYSTYSEISALGHDLIAHKAKAATCTEIGWDDYNTCSRCEYSTYVEKPATGHNIKNVASKSATCTEPGWNKYQYCTLCDFTTKVEKPALGHTYIDHIAVEPTCTENGCLPYQTCSQCSYSSYQELPALGHDYINHEAKAPTCTDYGWDGYQTCSRCDYSTYTKINALGHNIVSVPAKATSCSSVGWKAYTYCKVCEYTTYSEIPKIDHKYPDKSSVCSSCRKNKYADIIKVNDGVLSITNEGKESIKGAFSIPNEVTSIAADAFSGCLGLSDISISTSISSIGDRAFADTGLTLIDIPSSVESIGTNAFANCPDLKVRIHRLPDESFIVDIGVTDSQIEWVPYEVGYIGPTGGIIFYDCDADNTEDDPDGPDNLISSECGWRYIEASNGHIDRCYFGAIGGTSVKTYAAIGKGLENTLAIVEKLGKRVKWYSVSDDGFTMNYAAKNCLDYAVVLEDGTTVDDWFLPSENELSAMNKIIGRVYSWSSTVYNDYAICSYSGSLGYELTQDSIIECIPVRYFSVEEPYGHQWTPITHPEESCTQTVSLSEKCSICNQIRNTTLEPRHVYTKRLGEITYCERCNAPLFGPAGGDIIYDKGTYSDGWRYIEVAGNEIGNVAIGLSTSSSYCSDTSIGSGLRNTELIVSRKGEKADDGDGHYTSKYAAKVAFDYSENGYDDWFLPSLEELKLIYDKLYATYQRNFLHYHYVSSSEYSDSETWCVSCFDGGLEKTLLNSSEPSVIPVRRF